MSIVELLLRLGSSLVAWMVVITHVVWLATLRVVGCQGGNDEFYRLLLGFAPLAIAFAFVLKTSEKLPSVHPTIRWAVVPLAVLAPFAAIPVWYSLTSVTLGNVAICAPDVEIKSWHTWWAPVQLMTLAIVGYKAYFAWRPN